MRIVPALICAATIGFASHANAQQMASVQAGPTAELIARGAAVLVPVSFSCADTTHNYTIFVQVVQRSGNASANGSGSVGGFPTTTPCTPAEQDVEVPAMVFGGKTFKRGVAAVSVNIFACDEFQSNCVSVTDTREIRIVDEIR